MSRRKQATEDPAERIRHVIGVGIAAIEKQITALNRGKADPKKSARIVELVKDAGVLLGQVRRYDEAKRHAANQLSPAVVLEYLRALPADKRLVFLTELGGDDDEEQGSVLS